jgi:predicted ATP-dependent serine protease
VCATPLEADKFQCRACKTWCLNDVINEQAAKDGDGDGTVLLGKVKSADLDRLQTGFWDKVWGFREDKKTGKRTYGVVRGSTTLIGGAPGAGKSTLMLQMSKSVAELNYTGVGTEPLYIASEEQLEQISSRWDRMELTEELKLQIRMVPAMSGGVNLNDILAKYRPPFMILDSLKGLVGEDDAEAIRICKIMKDFAMMYRCPAVIAHHVTKEDVIAGKLSLQHEVDTCMTFFPEDDRLIEINDKGDTEAIRVLEVIKNRNGAAFVRQEFLMTALGLVEWTEEMAEAEEEEDEEE